MRADDARHGIPRARRDAVRRTGRVHDVRGKCPGAHGQCTRQLHEDARWVAHTREVLDLSGDTLRALVDAESGVRGFVITGKDDFLQNYEAAIPTFGRLFRKLKDETKDNPAQQARLQKLEEMATLRLGLFQEAIALRRQSEEDATAFIATGKGKAQMDAIRLLVQELEQVSGRVEPEPDSTGGSEPNNLTAANNDNGKKSCAKKECNAKLGC